MRRRILIDNFTDIVGANGYEYVDLGLSVLWATCNIGATKPEEYGLYFAWAETTGYKSGSDKPGGFNWNTTPYWVSGTSTSSTKWSKYTTHNSQSSTGEVDNKLILELKDDAAHIIMGGNWRMPTSTEYQELYNACNTTWTTINGVTGRLFTLKTDSSKQLFFPAAGVGNGSSMGDTKSFGYYWSSSLYNSSYAYYLFFHSSDATPQGISNRYFGCSIRGVLDSK